MRYGRKRLASGRCFRIALVSLLFLLSWTRTVFAEGTPIPCIMTGEDVGNGYEYTVPSIGSFTINGMEGETFQAAVFSLEGELFPVLYRDGEEADFEGGMVLDGGSYELRLYGTEAMDGDYGVFRFSVENDFTESLIMDHKEVKLVEDPPLTLSYQESAGLFRYTLPDGRWFDTNVPIGGWSRHRAEFTFSEGLNVYMARRDGEMIGISDGLNFGETGSYEIVARDNELGLEGEFSYRLTLGFRLYLNKTLDISLIRAPMGLSISRAEYDGQLLYIQDGGFLRLERDGPYRITFADGTGRECWQMEFIRDTVPPLLYFDREADGQTLTDSISFQIPDARTQVRILRGGEPVTAERGVIAVNGSYHVEAEDEAGNVRDYDFVLTARYPMSAAMWVIMLFMVLLASGGVFAYWRRNVKVL